MPTRARAALTLGAALLSAVLSLGVQATPIQIAEPGHGDIITFREVVNRVRQGNSYYEAMAGELRTRGYPMQSVFNWRTPLHLSLVALAPDRWAQAVLVALAVVAVCLLWPVTARVRFTRMACGTMAVGTVLVTAAPDAVFLPESWSGVLIGCSAGALSRRRTYWGVGAGLAALAMRELAAPYCVVCTAMALFNRDWTQVRVWLLGAVGYGLYFAWHVSGIAGMTQPDDLAQSASWVQFGGVPAVLAAMSWTSWWFLAPPGATPLLFTLVASGIVAPETPRHARVAGAVFLGFLLVAGQPFNHYWGLVAAPVWAVVAGCGAAGLVAAAGHLRRPSTTIFNGERPAGVGRHPVRPG